MAQRVGRGIALLFHDRGTRREWVVNSTPRPHFTPGKDPVPILQEAGWAPGPVRTGGKSRPHRDSIPNRPARSSAAIPTELPGPRTNYVLNVYLTSQSNYWDYRGTNGGSLIHKEVEVCGRSVIPHVAAGFAGTEDNHEKLSQDSRSWGQNFFLHTTNTSQIRSSDVKFLFATFVSTHYFMSHCIETSPIVTKHNTTQRSGN